MNKCSDTSHLTSTKASTEVSVVNTKQEASSHDLVTANLIKQNKAALTSVKTVKMAAIDLDSSSFVLGYN